MNQDNELARILRQSIEFADVEIAKETDELIKSKMIRARDDLLAELKLVSSRLR